MKEPEWKTNEMIYFDENYEGAIINTMSAGMSQIEVADFFGVNLSDLDVESEDFKFFRYHYKMGRAGGNKRAVHALFNQMDQRGGGQVALSYLIRFSEEWEENAADTEQKGKKSFRVILD